MVMLWTSFVNYWLKKTLLYSLWFGFFLQPLWYDWFFAEILNWGVVVQLTNRIIVAVFHYKWCCPDVFPSFALTSSFLCSLPLCTSQPCVYSHCHEWCIRIIKQSSTHKTYSKWLRQIAGECIKTTKLSCLKWDKSK